MNSFVFNARIANQQRGARAFVPEPDHFKLGLGLSFFFLRAFFCTDVVADLTNGYKAANWLGAGRRMKIADSIDDAYKPSEDEAFMSERQRDYFRRKLLVWKGDILRESRETLVALQTENENHPDIADRASSETDRAIELRARDRQRKLISKIDSALQRIEEGVYGFCEETGEPIALKRLDARPIATLSVEAQERHERREKVYRDD